MVIKAIKKNELKEIGRKESFKFYDELVKGIERSLFFIEKKDRKYDEPNKKESVFDCHQGLVRLIISINSVRNWKLKGDAIRTVKIEWFVKVFISRTEFDIWSPYTNRFLEHVQEKIYKESIRPIIEDGFRWSVNPIQWEGMLDLRKFKPLEVAKDIEKRIRDMTIVFDGVKGEVVKAAKRIDLLTSRVVDDEKRRINKILSLLR